MIEPKIYFPNQTLNKMNTKFNIKLAVTEEDPVVDKILLTTTKLIAEDLDEIERKFALDQADSLVNKFRNGDRSALKSDTMFQVVYHQCSIAEAVTHGYFNAFRDGKFDPTGLIRGWAVETLFQLHLKPLLIDPNIVGVAFNVGGNNVQVATKKGSDFQWNIAVKSPYDDREQVVSYKLKNGALATSNTNKIDGDVHGSLELVTILANGLTEASIWADAAMMAGLSRFENMIKESELTGMFVDDYEEMTSFAKGTSRYENSNLYTI